MAKNSTHHHQVATITVKIEDQGLPDSIKANSNGDVTISAPELLKSVSELHNLSSVLHVFKCKWDELQKHLDFIDTAIKDLEPPRSNEIGKSVTVREQLLLPPVVVVPQLVQIPVPALVKEVVGLSSNKKIDNAEQPPASVDNNTNKKPPASEYESLCLSMASRELKRLIISQLASPSTDVAKLRVDVIAAIKVAPRPEILVLQAVGGFYLQGIRAYNKESPLIAVRKASILILELFLLTGLCSTGKIDPEVKKESDAASTAWRKRLVSEGGVSQASHYDARGLLLFIGCFGFSSDFRSGLIRDLIRLSKPKEISSALCQSHALVSKISGTIEVLLTKGPIVEAVDLIITFGLRDKFHLDQVLLTFLRNSEEEWKKGMKEALVLTRHEANKKHFAALKSVSTCLNDHKIDPSLFQSEMQMKEKITILEKQIAEFEKKRQEETRHKRKADENELLRAEAERRSRYTTSSKSTLRSLEQMVDSRVDSERLYDGGLTQSYLMAGRRPGHVNSFYHPSSSGAISLPESRLDILAARYGSGLSTGSVLNSFPGDSRGDNPGAISVASNPSYGWPVDQSFDRQSAAMGISSLYQQPASTSATNRSAASNLYQFADAVVDRGSYYTRHPNSDAANHTSVYHPSYQF